MSQRIAGSFFILVNYPFDFAFFAHEAPGRCPTEKVPEICPAPAFTFLPFDLYFF